MATNTTRAPKARMNMPTIKALGVTRVPPVLEWAGGGGFSNLLTLGNIMGPHPNLIAFASQSLLGGGRFHGRLWASPHGGGWQLGVRTLPQPFLWCLGAKGPAGL